jgi:hypothetical protein
MINTIGKTIQDVHLKKTVIFNITAYFVKQNLNPLQG